MRSEIHFVVESARRQCGRRYVAGALVACALSGGVAARAQVSPNGGEFLVNTYTTNFQGHPAVAVDGLGNFVVAWDSDGSSGTDSDFFSIQAQRYAANGAALGGQFQVNTYTTNSQSQPAVAVDGLGNFVVAWESFGSSDTDTSSQSIQAQRYAANGAVQGGQFQVNTYTTSFQLSPAVAVDGQGNFVIAWNSDGSSGTDTSTGSIQARRYSADGTALGGQFQVNTYTTDSQSEPAVAVDSQGNFVVAWDSYGSSGTDTSSASIQAQRYAANGAVLGGQFQVNTYTTSHQFSPAVAVDGQGKFVVAWYSDGSSGTDTSYESIQAQRYAGNGAVLGGQFQVNTYTTSYQWIPAVAVDGPGNFVVAWQSDGSSSTDNTSYSIQARRYDGLFRDGFDTGGTARWSATVP